ncbi:hypothetical protein CRYUN_Cryun32bG0075200 [Craigia yunnanensis]
MRPYWPFSIYNSSYLFLVLSCIAFVSSCGNSLHFKYKIFLSAMEYLPFSQGDDLKGSFEEIIERLQSLQKALVVQWLCFTPPSTITDVKDFSVKLLLQAFIHSNILFREFALISMWRVPAMPVGAHELLSLLAEPLKQLSETPDTFEDYVSENLKEFQDWSEYYSCDATYRNWLKIELSNADVSLVELSVEEKERAIAAAQETLNLSLSLLLRQENPWLISVEEHVNVAISSRDSYSIEVVLRCLAVDGDGIGSHILNDGGLLGSVMAADFKGEPDRFRAGVTMEISQLDAWFSCKEGSLEGPATYIVCGLCRRCCIPEVILRCMQVSVSLLESGNPPESHDQLIELVSSLETGFIHLSSQLQVVGDYHNCIQTTISLMSRNFYYLRGNIPYAKWSFKRSFPRDLAAWDRILVLYHCASRWGEINSVENVPLPPSLPSFAA